MGKFETFEVEGLEEAMENNIDADDIESSSPYICGLVVDASGSMYKYDDQNSGEMSACLHNFVSAVINAKQGDEMLVSKTTFSDSVELGGYVAPADLDCDFIADGMTSLYDAIVGSAKLLLNYMKQITTAGTTPCGASIVILSDGQDNASRANINDAVTAISELRKNEVKVAFIPFGDEAKGIAQSLGIKDGDILETKNDPHALREALRIVSKSAISASKLSHNGASFSANAGFFDV